MLNVFIGVIIEKYNENKDNSEGSGLLTNEQKIWVETMKLTLNSRAKQAAASNVPQTVPNVGLQIGNGARLITASWYASY